MINNSYGMNSRNIYKLRNELNNVMKKGVSITLDKEILDIIDSICKSNLGAKRSTVINSLLKENSDIKKRLKKNEKKNNS